MPNVYHWNETPPQPEVTPRRMTIIELMQLRELLEARVVELRERALNEEAFVTSEIIRHLNEDIRDNNR